MMTQSDKLVPTGEDKVELKVILKAQLGLYMLIFYIQLLFQTQSNERLLNLDVVMQHRGNKQMKTK